MKKSRTIRKYTSNKFLPSWTVWSWNQVSDVGDNIGYGIKVNEEDEYLIGPKLIIWTEEWTINALKNHWE